MAGVSPNGKFKIDLNAGWDGNSKKYSYRIYNQEEKKWSGSGEFEFAKGHHPDVFITDDGNHFAFVRTDPDSADDVVVVTFSSDGKKSGELKLSDIYTKEECANLPGKFACHDYGFVYTNLYVDGKLKEPGASVEKKFLKWSSPKSRPVFIFIRKGTMVEARLVELAKESREVEELILESSIKLLYHRDGTSVLRGIDNLTKYGPFHLEFLGKKMAEDNSIADVLEKVIEDARMIKEINE